MRTEIYVKQEVEITDIDIEVPVRYDDDDMPYDYPFRDGDMWRIRVDIDTGQIGNWDETVEPRTIHMKVVDEGIYRLMSGGKQVSAIEQNYVPHGVVPGEYGDYIILNIDQRGIITNWPQSPDVSAFFDGGTEG